MKTIKHIRNTYAREQGFADWADLYRTAGYYDETKFFAHELATDQLIQDELKKKIVKTHEEYLFDSQVDRILNTENVR